MTSRCLAILFTCNLSVNHQCVPTLLTYLVTYIMLRYLHFSVLLCYRKTRHGEKEQLGFTINPGKSRRVRPVIQTDFAFVDDIALGSDSVEKAQALLLSVEGECQKMGLQLNAKKTEVMTFTINDKAKITTKNDTILPVKEDVKYLGSYISSDFKYLGSYISSTEKDIRVRKAHAWRALHDLKNVWHCAMPDDLKRAIFMASVESILLYGSDAYCSARSSARWLLHKYAQDGVPRYMEG